MLRALELLLDSSTPDIEEAVENMLMVNLEAISPYIISEILYILSRERKGTSTLVELLVRRVLKDSQIAGHLDATTICQSMIALNMAGVSIELEEQDLYAKNLSIKAKDLLPEEIEVLNTILSKSVRSDLDEKKEGLQKLYKALEK